MVHEPGTLLVTNFVEQLLTDLINTAEQCYTEYQWEINIVQDNTSPVTKTLWLRYNRWDKKFIGQDMQKLHMLTDPHQRQQLRKLLYSILLLRFWVHAEKSTMIA